MRFSELADWYFTNYAPQELKESTIYTYKGQYKNHIEPVLGNVKVKDINAPRLTQIMQETVRHSAEHLPHRSRAGLHS